MLKWSANSKRPMASSTSTLLSPGPLPEPVYSVLKVNLIVSVTLPLIYRRMLSSAMP